MSDTRPSTGHSSTDTPPFPSATPLDADLEAQRREVSAGSTWTAGCQTLDINATLTMEAALPDQPPAGRP